MRKLLVIICVLAGAAFAQGPALTTVSDAIYGGSGTITITNSNTFTTADGYVIPQGWTTTATLGAGGAFTVQLPPNAGSTPASHYVANYSVVPAGRFAEIWIVPSSASAVRLSAVRSVAPPSLSLMFAFDQLYPPANCLSLGGFVQDTSAGWTCSASSSNGLSNPMTTSNDLIVGGSGGTPQRLGTGTANQFLAGGTVWRDLVLGDLPDGCTGCVLLGQGLSTPPAYISDPEVQGLDAAGVAPTGNPVLVGGLGSDGNVHTLKTDASGTMIISFLAAQPVTQSGNWTFSLSGAIPAGSNTIGAVNVNGTVPVSGTFWQTTQPVSLASLPALAPGTSTIGNVGINGTVPVSGAFWQPTQPVSLASLPALAPGTSDIGKVDVNSLPSVAVNNFPATQPVSGIVQANAGTGWPVLPTTTAPLNDSTAGLTQEVAAASGKAIYFYYTAIAAGAVTVEWEYGTGTNCGTGTAALTGPMPVGTNGGAAPPHELIVPAGNALCVNLGSAVEVAGDVTYAQQ